MDREKEEKISYTICYALRHNPGKYGLSLDDNGFCDVNDFLNSLKLEYEDVSMKDIEYIVENDPKGRFELIDGKIRASYGHSFEKKIKHEEIVPPEILYHGTTLEVYDEFISHEGLKHQKRQYVHLSSTVETAIKVAQRRKNKTHIVLEVRALDAYKEGVKFYKAKEDVYLSDDIPPQFLRVMNNFK